MDADRETDVGQEMIEREQSNTYVVWVQARKEFEAELNARLAEAPRAEQNDLRWVLSVEWAEWMRANPSPPYPFRAGPFKPLALVGRGDNRSGPMTDG